jgi:prepilin peptidase CpaA
MDGGLFVWINLLLILLIIICFMTDILWRKIYNAVLFPIMGLAFVIHFIEGGLGQLTSGLLGFVVGLSILFIPYMLGGMGGGDVKLLAVIGALKGFQFVLITSVYMALIGGLIALVMMVIQGGAWHKIKKMAFVFGGLRMGIAPSGVEQTSAAGAYPYGIAITGGALVSLLLKGLF